MDRWFQIDQLFHRVVDLPAAERKAFLDDACAGDSALRRELESLLAQDAAPESSFMEKPAIGEAAIGSRLGPLLQQGQQIGAYTILSLAGKGGMGEVYKARDTKLGREVAIKMLPSPFALDPERVERFDQEARLLAALNHPNIATIHGIDEAEGRKLLVMELIEGDTLEERLKDGPFSIQQALSFALQIAEALESAHEKGVVHRDLKPGNIKITPEDRIKVLDFGLAKALGEGKQLASSHKTQDGLVLGTVAYMAPEQAKGGPVDRRADIWSFGCVLYEMLTGTSPFLRNTAAETLAQVLEGDPNLHALPAETPPSITRLIKRCFERSLRERLQHIGDARVEIRDTLAEIASGVVFQARRLRLPNLSRNWKRSLMVAGLLALGILIGTYAASRFSSRSPDLISRLYLPTPEAGFVEPFGIRRIDISPDSTRVVYAGVSGLWIRSLAQNEAVSLRTTPGSSPFFSPDGKWIAFFQGGGAGGALSKVPAGGGPVSNIVSLSGGRPLGGDWFGETIVFADSNGLFLVRESGGKPELLVAPDATRHEKLYAMPQFMPDGRSVLFTIVPEGSIEGAQIALLNLETPKTPPRILVIGGSSARYLPTGHLVYASGQVLKIVRYDPKTGDLSGDPVELSQERVDFKNYSGAADYAVSEDGTLVFLPPESPSSNIVVVVDRKGNVEPIIVEPGDYGYVRISPEGTRLAVNVRRGEYRSISIWNIQRKEMTPLTRGEREDMLPQWTLDATRVFYASDKGKIGVYSAPADGSTLERAEFESPGFETPGIFMADGKRMLTFQTFGGRSGDIYLRDLSDPGKAEPVLNSPARESLASLSADEKWILYQSDELGDQSEIFVRPYPDTSGGRIKISSDGGIHPRWSLDGSEIFYKDLSGAMMAVRVELSPKFKLLDYPGTKLFQDYPNPAVSGWSYDLWPGRGFLTTRPSQQAATRRADVSVVQNWFKEIRRLAP